MVLNEHPLDHLEYEQVLEGPIHVVECALLLLRQVLQEGGIVCVDEAGNEVHENHKDLPLLVVDVVLFDNVPFNVEVLHSYVLFDHFFALLLDVFVGIF